MSEWTDLSWSLYLNDHHTEADGARLLAEIRDWACDDGYADDIACEDHVITCRYVGECGWNAESDTTGFLEALAAREQANISLWWKSDEDGETTYYFGPDAGASRIADALAQIRDQHLAITKDQDAITRAQRLALARQAESLLELAGATVNSRCLKNVRLLMDRHAQAAKGALDDIIHELQIDEE
ncbi:MAG: hypothetical protein JXM73_13900 [Anaerolineae bacterium]|nr:hypothetical protein [Anaerolineae bacterium]